MNAWAEGFLGRPMVTDVEAQLAFTTKIFRFVHRTAALGGNWNAARRHGHDEIYDLILGNSRIHKLISMAIQYVSQPRTAIALLQEDDPAAHVACNGNHLVRTMLDAILCQFAKKRRCLIGPLP